ncbi:MAG: hypothetical protein ACE5FC_04440 [Myxococcota bacterium]
MTARRLRALALALVFVALYALSIPWYRTPGSIPKIWFGLPDWVVIATIAHVLVAALCSAIWLLRARDEEDAP